MRTSILSSAFALLLATACLLVILSAAPVVARIVADDVAIGDSLPVSVTFRIGSRIATFRRVLPRRYHAVVGVHKVIHMEHFHVNGSAAAAKAAVTQRRQQRQREEAEELKALSQRYDAAKEALRAEVKGAGALPAEEAARRQAELDEKVAALHKRYQAEMDQAIAAQVEQDDGDWFKYETIDMSQLSAIFHFGRLGARTPWLRVVKPAVREAAGKAGATAAPALDVAEGGDDEESRLISGLLRRGTVEAEPYLVRLRIFFDTMPSPANPGTHTVTRVTYERVYGAEPAGLTVEYLWREQRLYDPESAIGFAGLVAIVASCILGVAMISRRDALGSVLTVRVRDE
jgi:hypothetical protein